MTENYYLELQNSSSCSIRMSFLRVSFYFIQNKRLNCVTTICRHFLIKFWKSYFRNPFSFNCLIYDKSLFVCLFLNTDDQYQQSVFLHQCNFYMKRPMTCFIIILMDTWIAKYLHTQVNFGATNKMLSPLLFLIVQLRNLNAHFLYEYNLHDIVNFTLFASLLQSSNYVFKLLLYYRIYPNFHVTMSIKTKSNT